MINKTLMNFLKLTVSVTILTFTVYSCIPQSKLEYLQDPVLQKSVYQLHEKVANTVKPNDELYIRVSSFDDVAFNFFSSQTSTNLMSFSTDLSISLVSYTVNDSGYIYFPILGNIKMLGLTVDEVTQKLTDLLSAYFNQPTVIVKFVNKKVSLLGEVNQPGSYAYTKERISILEALSMAGDINVHGNIKNVILIRTIDESIVKYNIDLTKDNILTDENYYLQSNDIIYVKPRGSTKWSVIAVPITLVLTTVTTTLLIINFFSPNF
jgi:polysaccharide export outer membrane protein